MGFDTPITVTGPPRSPAQMLDEQSYDGHASVHDAGTASSMGLTGAPIEGPTHFSQFDPLAAALWSTAWFERGCISCHFQTMVVEGEQVQASMTTTGPGSARIEAHKVVADGAGGQPVLSGTASVGPDRAESELDGRLARLGDAGELFVVDRLQVGMRQRQDEPVSITHADRNGSLYPFSLDEKVARITEPHDWYTLEGAESSPWARAIVPFEMVSVVAHKAGRGFPVRQPSLGLFLDLEVRMLAGPVFVDQPYVVEHEVVGLGQSRRTESYWTRSTLTDAGSGEAVATVLLHSGVFKESSPTTRATAWPDQAATTVRRRGSGLHEVQQVLTELLCVSAMPRAGSRCRSRRLVGERLDVERPVEDRDECTAVAVRRGMVHLPTSGEVAVTADIEPFPVRLQRPLEHDDCVRCGVPVTTRPQPAGVPNQVVLGTGPLVAVQQPNPDRAVVDSRLRLFELERQGIRDDRRPPSSGAFLLHHDRDVRARRDVLETKLDDDARAAPADVSG